MLVLYFNGSYFLDVLQQWISELNLETRKYTGYSPFNFMLSMEYTGIQRSDNILYCCVFQTVSIQVNAQQYGMLSGSFIRTSGRDTWKYLSLPVHSCTQSLIDNILTRCNSRFLCNSRNGNRRFFETVFLLRQNKCKHLKANLL